MRPHEILDRLLRLESDLSARESSERNDARFSVSELARGYHAGRADEAGDARRSLARLIREVTLCECVV